MELSIFSLNESMYYNIMNSKPQKILFPWDTSKWPDTKKRIAEKIGSFVDMDSRVAGMGLGKLKPRRLSELLQSYYNNDIYASDRIDQTHLIDDIFPMMQKLIVDAPQTFKGFNARALVPGLATNIVLTRPQVATLISCMWFGLFNYPYLTSGAYKLKAFPEPLFIKAIESQNIFWLQCILNYFDRVYQYLNADDSNDRATFDAGNIIIKRVVTNTVPDWVNSDIPICEISIGTGHVTDTPAKLHTVYAHDIIGGEMFRGNLTQEEIILIVKPECLVTTLFCGIIQENEAIIVLGAEKISQYTGAGSSIKYAGNYIDMTPKGYSEDQSEVMSQTSAIFIDASSRTSLAAQLADDFMRDLNKAFIGFDALRFSKTEQIATGNWSYGFNCSHMQAKFLQMVIAASESGKALIYHSNNVEFEDMVNLFADWLQRENLTVGMLITMYLQIIKQYYQSKSRNRLSDLNIFECLMVGI